MYNLKKIILIHLSFFSIGFVQAQDFVIQPDGTQINGKMISGSGNSLKMKKDNGDLEVFKIDELSEVFIKDPEFDINRMSFYNTIFKKNSNGISIKMQDNPVRIRKTKSKNYASSSSIGIASDDVSPKTKFVIHCDDCSKKGHLVMKSNDGKSSLDWEYKNLEGDVFPQSFDIDANKTYTLTFNDSEKKTVSKIVKVIDGKEFRVNLN
jgi:hypothetical protein